MKMPLVTPVYMCIMLQVKINKFDPPQLAFAICSTVKGISCKCVRK